MSHFYAHSLPDRPQSEWEPLVDHLRLVATGNATLGLDGAAELAKPLGLSDWGRLLGFWHDLGKYSTEFQAYLCDNRGRVDHSTRGAQHAVEALTKCPTWARVIAYCIAGHHGGLPDAVDERGGASGLNARLKKTVPDTPAAPHELLEHGDLASPTIKQVVKGCEGFQLSVLTRMLFSCLVDADYLATEAFMSRERSAERKVVEQVPVATLLPRLEQHLDSIRRAVERQDRSGSPVNQARADVLRACIEKSKLAPGLFSLTVPTGGGKTLSSLAFALHHARRHDQRRVIYAVPYTSIIEQNADVFREALERDGLPVVLEHHSSFEDGTEQAQTQTESEASTPWHRLAAENWDARVIVTTNVQFFESLFASKPSRCRKLHRIARSVIILDEVQCLPVELLRPTLTMIGELCRNYGCTVVLSTATQPAFDQRDGFEIGFRRGTELREIVDDPLALRAALERTEIKKLGTLTNDAIADRLAKHPQALCIVNTKRSAAELFELLRSHHADGTFHLSTNLCPMHRRDTLAEIRKRLGHEQPCRVVSTQLIEAGVDVDFPVVYRSMAGLDSIHQAAGRCNREGRRSEAPVYVFDNGETPPASLKPAINSGREIAATCDDLLSLAAVERYFEHLYWRRGSQTNRWDSTGVMGCFALARDRPHFQFRKAAEAYRLIRDDATPIIVPYGDDGRRLIARLQTMRYPPNRDFARKLQQYAVAVRERQFNQLRENGAIASFHEHYHVLQDQSDYDEDLGLMLDGHGLTPEELIT